MASSSSEARIQDLKRRLELEPGSRLFVALAEEYRKSGRLGEALSTLQKGLLAHPSYLSAHVALGRAYLEAGQITEAIATFSRVLSTDPANLVSAKSLADIYLSRGESVEAIKKLKLYRALSGDRTVDDTIERLEGELAPPPPGLSQGVIPPPPPPTFYDEKPTAPIRMTQDRKFAEPVFSIPSPDPHDVTSVKFEPDESAGRRFGGETIPEKAAPSLPRVEPQEEDVTTTVIPMPEKPTRGLLEGEAGVAPSAFRMSEVGVPVLPAAQAAEPAFTASDTPEAVIRARLTPVPRIEAGETLAPRLQAGETPGPRIQAGETPGPPAAALSLPPSPEPHGRTLADLYFAQGHYAEALRIYDDLAAAKPFDSELKRLRRESEARLLPAGSAPDAGLERRLARIRALKQWLALVQAG